MPLSFAQQLVIFLHRQSEVSQDLPQKWSNNHLRSVIRDHYDATICVSEHIVATLRTNPQESGSLCHLSEVPIAAQFQARQAATSIFQVPMNSGIASCGWFVCR